MRFDCLQVTRRLSKLLGSQDDNQTGTQHPNDWGDTLHNITALGGGLTPGLPKQPKRITHPVVHPRHCVPMIVLVILCQKNILTKTSVMNLVGV